MGGTYIRNFICNFISHRKKEEKMKLKKRNVFIGITSFLIVLFTMPLGHAIDDLNGTPDGTGNHALRNPFSWD